jgi:predicted nucleic acid-binding protein
MSFIVLLDAGPLGLVTNPKASPETLACKGWLEALLLSGAEVRIPEIADYEVRRELLRADKFRGVQRLDDLKKVLGYVPLTTLTMLKAAELWAQIRKQGKSTADDRALDGDVILAAQATLLAREGNNIVIATTNVGHLARFVQAKQWKDVTYE